MLAAVDASSAFHFLVQAIYSPREEKARWPLASASPSAIRWCFETSNPLIRDPPSCRVCLSPPLHAARRMARAWVSLSENFDSGSPGF